MRKLVFLAAAVALGLGVGVFAWNAEATTPAGVATLGAQKNYSPLVKETACRGWGRHCPPGFVWVCGPARCWCRPC